MNVIGVVGWKNSGKTTLIERLVRHLSASDLRVSTVKHTHHDIATDVEGTDSSRHTCAGAHEVALVTGRRWAIFHECTEISELGEVLARMARADLFLIEGFKYGSHAKLEVYQADEQNRPPMALARLIHRK